MRVTQKVKKILDRYESDNPGTKANLARILMHGQARRHRQAGDPAGRPGLRARPGAQLRAEPAGLRSALPLPARDRGRAERLCRAARHDRGRRRHLRRRDPDHPQAATAPTAWPTNKDQAVTAGVTDALRLGCAAIGFTIYPGSEYAVRADGGAARADRRGEGRSASPSWSGAIRAARKLDKAGETAIDICAYAAHMAALLGAHIIKVKPPTARDQPRGGEEDLREGQDRHLDAGQARRARRCSAAFNGRRIVVFSGGEAKDLDGVFERGPRPARRRRQRLIIGRNTFQRPKERGARDARQDHRHLPGQGLSAWPAWAAASDGCRALSDHAADARSRRRSPTSSPRRSTPAMSRRCSCG